MQCVKFLFFKMLRVIWVVSCFFSLTVALGTVTQPQLAPHKPKLESLLKPKSLKKILEEREIIANASWEDKDFIFKNGILIAAPLKFSRARILDFSLYPKMTSAIHKFEYDEKTGLLEVEGEAGGFHLHSWIKPDLRYWDQFAYEFVRGDLTGFKIDAYLFEEQGKTVAVASGFLPGAKDRFPKLLTFAFGPIAEIVLSVATKNFRNYIEAEYNKK